MDAGQRLDLTGHWFGIAALVMFVGTNLLVMAEEFIHLRKSKPVMLAAGLIWGLIGWVYMLIGIPHSAEIAVLHTLCVGYLYPHVAEQRGILIA